MVVKIERYFQIINQNVNVTRRCLNRPRVYCFEKLSCFTSAFACKLYAYNTSMGNSNSMFRTPVHSFFSTFSALKTWFELSRVKLKKWSEGRQKLIRVSGRFELSRIRVTEGKITVNVQCMTEIQRKSILVRVSARFELARVRVIGIQLYNF